MQTKHLTSSKLSWHNLLFCFGVSGLLLSGCGGSGSDDIEFLGGNIDKNVALVSNGASATANYNEIQASKVIDGDTSTSEYWSGNIKDDYVTINFGKVRNIKEFHIYTNDTNFNSSLIEISTDSLTWSSTGLTSGADINCSTLSSTAPKISCFYNNRKESRYIRFTTKLPDPQAGSLNVYEIQVIGY